MSPHPVVLIGRMYHPDAEARLRAEVPVEILERPTPEGIAGARIGVPMRLLQDVGLDVEVEAAFQNVLAHLRGLGASIVEVETTPVDDVNASGTRIILLEAWAHYGKDVHARPQAYGEEFAARVSKARALTPADRDAASSDVARDTRLELRPSAGARSAHFAASWRLRRRIPARSGCCGRR